MEQADLIWHNGEFVPWEDAKTHVLSHALHYGTGVFEGVRCYETERGPAVFRHLDHLDRLQKSAGLFYLDLPYTTEELRLATHELIQRNQLGSCYIRPLAFRGYGNPRPLRDRRPDRRDRRRLPWGAYLGEDERPPRHPRQGLELAADQPRRPDPARQGLRPVPQLDPRQDRVGRRPATKRRSCSTSAASSARARARTSSSSATGEIVTPPHVAAILDGINRKSVIQIARDLGYTVVERDVARAELYLAEEVFLTGTAAELVPVREIDDHPIGEPGEITRTCRQVRGRPARPRRGVPGVARLRRAAGATPSKVSS
jgi:branched-chain amino acid aminotransferase